MIYALLSDIHSNLEALQACLAHAGDNGAERYAFLGDHVGYGADPEAVVGIIAGHAARGAVVIKGNHDEAVASDPEYMNEVALEVIRWTRSRLDDAATAFLAGLPLLVREPGHCFVHATASHPQRWEYIDSRDAARASMEAAERPYTFSGHIHDQLLYFQTGVGKVSNFVPTAASPVPIKGHHRWLALVGSVGQPRDRNPAAAYALFDAAREEITFHRIPYDQFAAARKIRAAGLPESLAYRVERGI